MTAPEPHRPVVVGTDGSRTSEWALAWAAEEAQERGIPLRAVYAVDLSYGPGLTVVSEDGGPWRTAADLLLEDVTAQVSTIAPGLDVTAEARTGSPAAVLQRESRAAALMVVGARGCGGFPGLHVGSVAAQLSVHAQCPVVIVPHPDGPSQQGSADEAGTVVAGVDGSATSLRALEFASRFASRRGLDLAAVHVWTNPVGMGTGHGMPIVTNPAELAAAAERVLAESLAGWKEDYPDVHLTRRLVQGHPASELIREARGASLLALGTRGRGGFRGLLLGSVSQAVIQQVPCPLAVVPPDAS